MNIERVTTARLRTLQVGESRIFTEPPSCKNAGSSVSGYASRIGIKVTTTACIVAALSTVEAAKGIVVTRTR